MSVGLGFRREMLAEVAEIRSSTIDFLEIAPENWMTLGGKYRQMLDDLSQQHSLYCHGLSLSIGSSDPLDVEFVRALKVFLDEYNVVKYSEHLSYCSHQGHLYDLLPIPFTKDAMLHTIERINRVQDIIQRPLILENASYYCAPAQKLSELEFTLGIVEKSQCKLLLDVNNVYVNSVNHGYNAIEFIQAIPSECIEYLYVAGHYEEEKDLLVDTHGASVCEDVWALLSATYDCHGVLPTVLERDFNIPPMSELLGEVAMIKDLQTPTGIKTV